MVEYRMGGNFHMVLIFVGPNSLKICIDPQSNFLGLKTMNLSLLHIMHIIIALDLYIYVAIRIYSYV